MRLPDFGEEGQRRLLTSHAVIVGVGATGCAIADLLARAGVGTLTLIDRDVVEESNLQRQCLFTEADAHAGLPKAEAAANRLRAVNSSIDLRPVVADLTGRNAERLVESAQVILDGADNFETRFLLNDVAVKRGVPYVYGGVVGTALTMMTVVPGETACLRCTLDECPAPGTQATCESAGVFGPAVAMLASWQATEAVKLLIGRRGTLSKGLHAQDVWLNVGREIRAERRSDCPCCGQGRFEFLENRVAAQTAALCGRDAVQVWPGEVHGATIGLGELAVRFAASGEVQSGTSFVRLRPAGESFELTVFADGRAIVKGTNKPEIARSVYARFVGV